jgi:hypothetical protein
MTAWHQTQLRVIAFHLGVQPNGEEITMSAFEWFLAIAEEETFDLARAMIGRPPNCDSPDSNKEPPMRSDSDGQAVSMIVR